VRILCILSVLGVILGSCYRDTSTITGRLVGADGRPLALAHVHLIDAMRPIPGSVEHILVTERIQRDGTFRISTNETGPFVLRFTAVGHRELRIPLAIETHVNLLLDAQLATAVPDPMQSEMLVLTTSDEGATIQRAYLVKQEDGTFRADLPSTGDSVMYTVPLGELYSRSTTLLGATASRYEFTSQAEYSGVLPVENGHATIEYGVPSQSVPSEAAFQFQDAISTPALFAQMQKSYAQFLAFSDSSLMRHMGGGKSFDSFTYPWLEKADSLLRAAALRPNGLIKDELALEALQCYLRAHIPIGDDRLRALVFGIPNASLAWVYHGTLALVPQRIPGGGAAYFESIVERHPWRPFAAWLLFYQCAGAQQVRDDPAIKVTLARLTKEFGNTDIAHKAQEFYAPRAVLQIGAPLPEFAFASADDSTKVFTNAAFSGHYLLIIFWNTWCSPCVGEMPGLHRTHDKYAQVGLKILSVALRNEPHQLNRFRQMRWPMPWSVAYVPENGVSSVVTRFAAATPKHILVDPKGDVLMIDSLLYGNELDSTLAHLLLMKQ
jgi:thiol-disulfide isomerase/thioredoxin